MMNIPAKELKRRGLAAVEDMLKNGPVEIIKNNKPACVVISLNDYSELVRLKKKKPKNMKITEIFSLPAAGTLSRKEIDERLKSERKSWEKD
jgi:PHD/YefM family antitoxin component YafN of YafNO toxin-antitoxin module